METVEQVTTKTDGQIYDMAMDEWLDQLIRLWDAVGKPLDADRLQIYRRELSAIPLGLLEKAISRVLRGHIYASVPAIGEVWNAVRDELGCRKGQELEAIEHWCDMSWDRCFIRFDRVAMETEA